MGGVTDFFEDVVRTTVKFAVAGPAAFAGELLGGSGPEQPAPGPNFKEDKDAIEAAELEERRRQRLLGGRMATIVAGELTDAATTASKTLLGE